MCGIVYCAGLDGQPVNKLVAQQFNKQRSRGTEGFGFLDNTSGHIIRATKERKILSKLRNRKSSDILFHHRYPTSTDNVKNACHPFSTRDFFDKKYVLVHNGWLTNAWELKTEHEKLGIQYASVQPDGRFNDSEALLWDVSLYLEGKQDTLKAEGAIAFICIERSDTSNMLYFGRNSSPLNMSLDNRTLMLSSEGEGTPIERDTLYTYDYASGSVYEKPLEIKEYSYVSTYPYSSSDYTDNYSDNSTYTSGVWYGDSFVKSDREVDYLYFDEYMSDADMSFDIKSVYRKYAREALGVYQTMYDLITHDLEIVHEAIRNMKDEDTDIVLSREDLEYTASVMKEVVEMLLDEPRWYQYNSCMPEYEQQAGYGFH